MVNLELAGADFVAKAIHQWESYGLNELPLRVAQTITQLADLWKWHVIIWQWGDDLYHPWYFGSKFEKLNWKMWQQNEDAKLKAGLNVYNRSGGGQAIPATPGLPQCHNSMHKATTPRTFVHQSLFTSLCYITTMHFCTNLDQNVPECVQQCSEQHQRYYMNEHCWS